MAKSYWCRVEECNEMCAMEMESELRKNKTVACAGKKCQGVECDVCAQERKG